MQPRPRLMTERIVSRPFPIGTRAPRVPLDRRARRPPSLPSFFPSFLSFPDYNSDSYWIHTVPDRGEWPGIKRDA